MNEARDEFIRTSTDAKKAADALEIFRRQLRNIRLEAMSPARRILTEGEERRKRAGRLTEGQRRRRGEPGDSGAGMPQGGFDQFSATRGGGDRLRTDDTTAHALLESINRGVNRPSRGLSTIFSATGGVVTKYAKMGAGIPNWKPRGTDTVPAQTPDGQPYGLTPGERVMSVKATNAFGPQLASMERSAQTGIGLATGGIIYAQGGAKAGKAGVGPTAPAPAVGKNAPDWMTHTRVSDLSPELQKQYEAMGYGPDAKLWFGSNQELRGPILSQGGFTSPDKLKARYQRSKRDQEFSGSRQFQAIAALMAYAPQRSV